MLQLHRIARWKSLLENDITDDERTMPSIAYTFPERRPLLWTMSSSSSSSVLGKLIRQNQNRHGSKFG